MTDLLQIHCGDWIEVLKTLPGESVQACVTSPPYWSKRDYCHSGQIGLEKTPELYIEKLCLGFEEVRRVLKKDGTLWIVIGDTRIAAKGEAQRGRVKDSSSKQATNYASDIPVPSRSKASPPGYKTKDLCGTPFMLAFGLRARGWYWRQINIWHKPNAFTESVRDRTGDAHEYVLHFSKNKKYYYNHEAISEPACALTLKRLEANWKGLDGRDYKGFPGAADRNQAQINRELREKHLSGEQIQVNKRSVWTIGTVGFNGEHFATYPPSLVKIPILASSRPGDTVLDPFFGSGTTGMIALELGRKCIGIELNPAYIKLAEERCNITPGLQLA